MTSRDYDVILVMSQTHNLQSRRIPKLGPGPTVRADPLSTHYIVEHCTKNQLIRLRTLKHLARPHSERYSAIYTTSAFRRLLCSVQRTIG